ACSVQMERWAILAPSKVNVVPIQFLDRSKYPIIMGVGDRKCCLSCSSVAQPVLYLEMSDRLIMDLYKHPEESKHFTFNNTFTGSTHHFESATYLGWFHCTSQKSDEPLGITSHTGESEITDFYFQKILS
uniref:Interleukin-1 n=1 Tax=Chelydra serpentina TaxID=8475 RepID=A0A8C3SKZ5_CHESE